MRENLCMQAASLELKQYPSIVNSVLDEYSTEMNSEARDKSVSSPSRPFSPKNL